MEIGNWNPKWKLAKFACSSLSMKPSYNSGFKKWLVLSFLVGKYSTGKLYIFTTNYKVVATS